MRYPELVASWICVFFCMVTPQVEAGSPPMVTITDPSDLSEFKEGTSIAFAGTANDPEEGDLTANLA